MAENRQPLIQPQAVQNALPLNKLSFDDIAKKHGEKLRRKQAAKAAADAAAATAGTPLEATGSPVGLTTDADNAPLSQLGSQHGTDEIIQMRHIPYTPPGLPADSVHVPPPAAPPPAPMSSSAEPVPVAESEVPAARAKRTADVVNTHSQSPEIQRQRLGRWHIATPERFADRLDSSMEDTAPRTTHNDTLHQMFDVLKQMAPQVAHTSEQLTAMQQQTSRLENRMGSIEKTVAGVPTGVQICKEIRNQIAVHLEDAGIKLATEKQIERTVQAIAWSSSRGYCSLSMVFFQTSWRVVGLQYRSVSMVFSQISVHLVGLLLLASFEFLILMLNFIVVVDECVTNREILSYTANLDDTDQLMTPLGRLSQQLQNFLNSKYMHMELQNLMNKCVISLQKFNKAFDTHHKFEDDSLFLSWMQVQPNFFF